MAKKKDSYFSSDQGLVDQWLIIHFNTDRVTPEEMKAARGKGSYFQMAEYIMERRSKA
jgi:hypothetical protein